MICMNDKMKCFLCENSFNDKIDMKKLSDRICSNTKYVNDCILYNENESLSIKNINWKWVIQINGDYTGYEVNCNEIILPDEIFSVKNLLQFLDELKKHFKNKYPNKNICFIFSYADKGFLRFHTYRAGEGLWLSSELDNYEDPVLYELDLQ